MSTTLLGATGGKPAVEIISVPEGERLPLPLGIDDGYGFDHALSRDGWIAVHVGYQVVALTDGDLLRPLRLPEAWGLSPASDARLVLLRRYFGRSTADGEPETIELVDATGTTLQSVTAHAWGAAGELRSGLIVARDCLVSWDGKRDDLPVPGHAEGVIGGRYVIAAEGPVLRVFDTDTGATTECALPHDSDGLRPFLLSPTYDIGANSVAYAQWRRSDVLVVTVGAPPRWIEVGFAQRAAVWLDQHRLLLVGERAHTVVNVQTDERSEVDGFPRRAHPRLDVSGRFDAEQLRAALRPRWKGVIPDSERAELLAASWDHVRQSAEAAGLPDKVLAEALPAIRLRSCLAPKTVTLGASRFGGRPDLPRGRSWPAVDGVPRAFLAQLRCDELGAVLPERAIPRDGLLVVFVRMEPDGNYPWESGDSLHVEVVPIDQLKRHPWPSALAEELRYDSSLAVAEPMVSIPDRRSIDAESIERFKERARLPGPLHQMFGHPSTIQGHPPPVSHELLLQFDGDAIVGAEFGDGGRLHIWFPTGTALSGVLEHCLVEMDCY